MSLKLVFSGDAFRRWAVTLTEGRFTLGRGADNAITLRHPEVSRLHCEFVIQGMDVLVRDRGSSNGTFVDGLRAEDFMEVRTGQILRFGSVEAFLTATPNGSPDTRIEDTAIHDHVRFLQRLHRPPLPAESADPATEILPLGSPPSDP